MEIARLVPCVLYLYVTKPSGCEDVLERTGMTAIVIDIELNDSARLWDHRVEDAFCEIKREHSGDDGEQGVPAGQEMKSC